MLDTKDPDKIIDTVLTIQPGFGGVNLEDISQPKCFRILDTLRERAEIPIWHDDQQGSALVVLAGLINALQVVGKKMNEVRITFIGAGAAGIATARLLFASGVDPALCCVVDINGLIYRGRPDIELRKAEFIDLWRLSKLTNPDGRQGGIAEALVNADVVIAFSAPGPGTLQAEWIRSMAPDPIVFACANPSPEIWPWEAKAAGAAIVATGRSDFPNQVNNSLGFPGLFRGTLDVRAKTITDEMCLAAAHALAAMAREKSLNSEYILPTMDEWDVFPREAAAVAVKAVEQGLAHTPTTFEEEYHRASAIIKNARDMTQVMMDEGLIEMSN